MSVPLWLSDMLLALRESAPALLGAGTLILVGWAMAWLLRRVTGRVVTGALARAERRRGLAMAMAESGAQSTIPEVVGAFVFWLVLLFFVAAALEALGLELVSGLVNRLTSYLPNVLGAAVVVVGGLVLGNLLQRVVGGAARSAGIARGEAAGGLARGAVLLVAAVVALDQLGVDAQLLVVLLAVIAGASFAGAGLAFGLGAQGSVRNIIAGYYVAQTYRAGQRVRIGTLEGRILQTTPTAVLLEGSDGQVLIPAGRFTDEVSTLLTAEG